MSDKETIIEKIRKLLRLAERAGTPAESQAAFARASELLYKHKLSRAEVGSIEEKREIAKVLSESVFSSQSHPFAEWIITVVAENFACLPYTERQARFSTYKRAGFFGFKDDAEIAKIVFENAFAFVKRETAGMLREKKYFYGKGFCEGLCEKFEEMRRANEQFAIVMKPPQEANEFAKGLRKPAARRGYDITSRTMSAYDAGKEAGKAFNPHSSIDGQRAAHALKG